MKFEYCRNRSIVRIIFISLNVIISSDRDEPKNWLFRKSEICRRKNEILIFVGPWRLLTRMNGAPVYTCWACASDSMSVRGHTIPVPVIVEMHIPCSMSTKVRLGPSAECWVGFAGFGPTLVSPREFGLSGVEAFGGTITAPVSVNGCGVEAVGCNNNEVLDKVWVTLQHDTEVEHFLANHNGSPSDI
jgi:hypothetical protein